ncbi:MAG TPA: protoporphyrinogen oxidase [Desulfobacteraceae bacterium]|nr:protoporphyrinogen oxidase [Desulfobacteraceae bacterium]
MKTRQVDVLIAGAGLSGLSVARFLRRDRPELSLLVLEKSDRPGGAILSHCEEGYLAEWGAHGFLDNCEESRALLALAGLEGEVEKAPLGKFVRYVCLGGKLRLIPQKPGKIIAAPLVPFWAKLRVLGDLWKKPLPGEPTVAEWVAHRFGSSLLPFADAVFTGTYAGDIDRLKIDAVMPGVRGLEREHGSVIRGLLRKRAGMKKGPGKRPLLPAMTSFKSGMGRLPQALAEGLRLNDELYYRTGVTAVSPAADGWWEVRTSQHAIRCRHLVLALPVNQTLALLEQVREIAPPPMASIPEAKIATIALGFTDRARVPFGFGYLAPEQEHRFALGALFSSHMFPGRAPRGHILLEALVGGRRHLDRLELDDEELVSRVYDDLRRLLDLPEEPCFARVLRPGAGIPQLEEGYPALLNWLDGLSGENAGLHVCGFGWRGIGINDMTKEAAKIAAAILEKTGPRSAEAEVKPVYF